MIIRRWDETGAHANSILKESGLLHLKIFNLKSIFGMYIQPVDIKSTKMHHPHNKAFFIKNT